MDKTNFAGLTRLGPGESLSTDGYSFQAVNPLIIDYLLNLGAVLHKHDEHAAMAAPVDDLVVTLGGGGTIPNDIDVFFTYTFLDAYGGETLPGPIVSLSTSGSVPAPVSGPSATADYSAGTLLPGTYYYVLTYVDADGNETTISPYTVVTVSPGFANAQVEFTGLSLPTGATGWRLYRAGANSPYYLLASGITTTFNDDGSIAVNCNIRTPTSNTTGSTSSIDLDVPTLPAGSTGFRIYASTDGSFTNPALVGTYLPDQTSPITLNSLILDDGEPPVVPTAVAGASKIDPDTDMVDFPWKRPVANLAALPAVGNTTGDIRMTLDTITLYAWDGAAWSPLWGRFTTTVTAAGLVSGGQVQTTIPIAPSYSIFRVVVNYPARVRLYATATYQASDIARPPLTPPTGDHGVTLDQLNDTDLDTAVAPGADGMNLTAVDPDIPITIDNLDTVTRDITVTLYYLRRE